MKVFKNQLLKKQQKTQTLPCATQILVHAEISNYDQKNQPPLPPNKQLSATCIYTLTF